MNLIFWYYKIIFNFKEIHINIILTLDVINIIILPENGEISRTLRILTQDRF